MKHIVNYSGGICSFMCAKRVVERYGKENVLLLFCDTLIEDADLYRFIDETVNFLGCEFVRIADGRTPFQVYKDQRFLGNSKYAPCSKTLKGKLGDKWIHDHYKPDECIIYFGIDWTETHRCKSIKAIKAPYQVEFPMCEEPYLDKQQMIDYLHEIGIVEPLMYRMGFSHNNCGGFCCRAGQGHYKHLLEVFPERFAEYERQEQEVREHLGRDDIAMMQKQKNGVKFPYTLKQLREDYERGKEIDKHDIGGCGCFTDV